LLFGIGYGVVYLVFIAQRAKMPRPILAIVTCNEQI
jgi:hypothetical protein